MIFESKSDQTILLYFKIQSKSENWQLQNPNPVQTHYNYWYTEDT